jgi:CRISPR-associated protein Csb1
MSETLSKFDAWLADDGPAALVIREHLQPVETADGVVFPPTFAAGDNFPGGYNIDTFADGTSVCLIDSVGSQANRMEPLFLRGKYAELVPQVVIKAGERQVNLLEAGHRAADALVRCSALQAELHEAFKAVLKGDAERLARIAPTSLVFGVWDSRGTHAKLPRLVSSVIRAYDVRPLTRSAQYVPAAEYVDSGLLPKPAGKEEDTYAKRGFVHVPASAKPGGVIARGGIRRDATLSLAALRLLRAGWDEKKTLALRRYVLGLALTAFTHSPSGHLRQGCLLVADPDKPREFVAVYGDGKRLPANLTHDGALDYAAAAAREFGVGTSREVPFDNDLALKDVRGEAGEAPAGGKGGKGKAARGGEGK